MQEASSGVAISEDERARPSDVSQSGSAYEVRTAISHALHYLPTQGPISIFVHHNTLHQFEELPFSEAVIRGGRRYNCEPYLSEDRYRRELQKGRITVDDLRQALMDDLGEGADSLIASFGTRYTLRLAMLQMTLEHASDAELEWLTAETDLLRRFRTEFSQQRREQTIQQTRSWVMRYRRGSTQSDPVAQPESRFLLVVNEMIDESPDPQVEHWSDGQWEAFVLRLLWRVCHDGVNAAKLSARQETAPTRLRDLLVEITGEDVDRTVDEVLIRFCGVFLDQGFADWKLPNRDQGFARAFASLYVRPMAPVPPGCEAS